MQHFDRLLVSSSVKQILRRLLESKDHKAQEKDEEADGTQREQGVPPSHVARLGTAGLAGTDQLASLQICIAGIFWNEAVGDTAGNFDTNWLKNGKQGQEKATILED